MKKEKIIAISIVILFVAIFGAFKYYSSPSEGLCVYEIPNHIKLECPNGNDTRVVNYFQMTLLEYKNALEQDCIDLERLNDSGFRYEISKCNESIPFEVFK